MIEKWMSDAADLIISKAENGPQAHQLILDALEYAFMRGRDSLARESLQTLEKHFGEKL